MENRNRARGFASLSAGPSMIAASNCFAFGFGLVSEMLELRDLQLHPPTNDDVVDLYQRVKLRAEVVVLSMN
jgi:hypothetical protein